jgi:hypothetical protein
LFAYFSGQHKPHDGMMGSFLDDTNVHQSSSTSFSYEFDSNEDDDIQDLWSMDRTMLTDLPLLWDIMGTLCRSTSTAVSLAKTCEEDDSILLTWREECEVAMKSLVQVMFSINIISSSRCCMKELSEVFSEEIMSSGVKPLVRCEKVLRGLERMTIFSSSFSATQNVWQALCGCEDVCNPEVDNDVEGTPVSAPVFSKIMLPLYGNFITSILIDDDYFQDEKQDNSLKKDFPTYDLLIILKVKYIK